MKLPKEVKTVTIAITGIAAFFVGSNSLKSKSIFNKANTYYAYFPHSGGLKTGTQVTVNGVEVGSVEAVDLEEKTTKIKITMEYSDGFPFSKNSIAELYSSLSGGAGLQIIPAFDNAPIAVLGDILEARIQEDMLVFTSPSIKPTQEKLNYLLNWADTTLTGVNKTLDAKISNDLKVAIAGISATVRNLNQALITLNKLLTDSQSNLYSILQSVNKTATDLAKVSGKLLEAELNKVIADAQTTLNNLSILLAGIEGGKGIIGKLMRDKALYRDLGESAKQLELLSQDFRLNPKHYVYFSIFSKKAEAYEP